MRHSFLLDLCDPSIFLVTYPHPKYSLLSSIGMSSNALFSAIWSFLSCLPVPTTRCHAGICISSLLSHCPALPPMLSLIFTPSLFLPIPNFNHPTCFFIFPYYISLSLTSVPWFMQAYLSPVITLFPHSSLPFIPPTLKIPASSPQPVSKLIFHDTITAYILFSYSTHFFFIQNNITIEVENRQ